MPTKRQQPVVHILQRGNYLCECERRATLDIDPLDGSGQTYVLCRECADGLFGPLPKSCGGCTDCTEVVVPGIRLVKETTVSGHTCVAVYCDAVCQSIMGFRIRSAYREGELREMLARHDCGALTRERSGRRRRVDTTARLL